MTVEVHLTVGLRDKPQKPFTCVIAERPKDLTFYTRVKILYVPDREVFQLFLKLCVNTNSCITCPCIEVLETSSFRKHCFLILNQHNITLYSNCFLLLSCMHIMFQHVFLCTLLCAVGIFGRLSCKLCHHFIYKYSTKAKLEKGLWYDLPQQMSHFSP